MGTVKQDVAKQLRVVDLFAGWGGFTEGIQQAGHKVVYAANHWQIAVEAHSINHPGVEHVCQDLHQANFCMLPEYDVLVASPACQGHSSASQPKRRSYHDELRATAHAVLLAAEATMPKAIIIENVPDFRRWGPPGRPDGSLYRHWKRGLELLGYDLTELIVDATKHGVPQRRNRLFIVATLQPGIFQYRPTHPEYLPEAPVGKIIDWGGRRWRGTGEPTEQEWRPISIIGTTGAAAIKKARKRGLGRRFIGQHVTGHPGVPLSEAIRTITCQDQWFVVKGDVYRPLTVRETARAMGFPDTYEWPEGVTRRDCIIGLGNAVCPPVARDLISQLAEVISPGGRGSRRARPAPERRAAKRRVPKTKAKKAKALPAAPVDTFDLLELARRARQGNPAAPAW